MHIRHPERGGGTVEERSLLRGEPRQTRPAPLAGASVLSHGGACGIGLLESWADWPFLCAGSRLYDVGHDRFTAAKLLRVATGQLTRAGVRLEPK